MPEYIEVNQLWKCETCFYHRSGKCTLGAFGCDHGESYRPAYSKLKKADVAPVVHARWERLGETYENCTHCGWIFEALPTQYFFESNNKFCRMCGARMGCE